MNKVQLNKLLCQQILTDDTFLKAVFTVTGEESIPIQVHKGQKSLRMDLALTFEEADGIIAQQVVAIGINPDACVLADDTDVFVLLLFFYGNSSL